MSHSSLPAHRKGEIEDTNVRGTHALLTVAAEASSTKGLVYMSTVVEIYVDSRYVYYVYADKLQPLWPAHRRSKEYSRVKAVADSLVR
jgi:nucleoside-diphosphate-sugar epimerase